MPKIFYDRRTNHFILKQPASAFFGLVLRFMAEETAWLLRVRTQDDDVSVVRIDINRRFIQLPKFAVRFIRVVNMYFR